MNQGTFHQSKYKLTKLKSLALSDAPMSINLKNGCNKSKR